MKVRLLRALKYTAAYVLLISALIAVSVPAAQADALFLFRSPEVPASVHERNPRDIQQESILKLDEKGDLLIQCGCTRFTVAYNAPADQFKTSGLQYSPQRENTATINGISLTASLSF